MTGKTKSAGFRLFSLLAVIAILFSGCGHRDKISPTASEITELSPAAGFLAARAEESGGFIAGEEQRKNASEHAYLYDNSVAVIVLSYTGAQWHAERIADAIVFAQTHDRSFRDGRLRNSYISGDPKSDSGRSVVERKVTIRLPGFWEDGRWQEDAYAVSTSAGNMAWAIMALCAAAENASEEKRTEYLNAAMRAADFVLTLESESGGFTAGYEGWDERQTKASYKSTEHNINIYCALSALSEAIAESDAKKSSVYKDGAQSAVKFVFSMYDKKLHCFYTGTKEDGKTVSDGVIPLDANCLTVLALGDRIDDAYKTLSFVEDRMSVGEGFDFSAGDLDGIWNEGTAQMAVAYSVLGNKEKYEALMAYLKTQTGKDGSIPAADRDGVSTGFVVAGTKTLWEYNNAQSIGATGWLALAQLGRNPYEHASE